MSILSFQLTRPWHIKLPVLIRYLEQKYIEEFFSKGSLRISSFLQFAKHKDEAKCDSSEGFAAFDITQEQTHLSGLGIFGRESYVFSASTVEDIDLMKQFGYDGYFKIHDSMGFASVVANHIPGFFEGFQGSCIYRKERSLCFTTKTALFDEIPKTEKEAEEWENKLDKRLHQELRLEPYFLKLLKYAYQNEYRLVWCVSGRLQSYVDIECPEAIKYCTKVT